MSDVAEPISPGELTIPEKDKKIVDELINDINHQLNKVAYAFICGRYLQPHVVEHLRSAYTKSGYDVQVIDKSVFTLLHYDLIFHVKVLVDGTAECHTPKQSTE